MNRRKTNERRSREQLKSAQSARPASRRPSRRVLDPFDTRTPKSAFIRVHQWPTMNRRKPTDAEAANNSSPLKARGRQVDVRRAGFSIHLTRAPQNQRSSVTNIESPTKPTTAAAANKS